MKVFAEEVTREFERQFIAEIRTQYPEIFQELGEQGVLQQLRQAEVRCGGHGIASSQGIRTWARLMLAFGSDFDTDREWAENVLKDSSKNSEAAKLEALFAAAEKAAVEMEAE